MMNITRRLTKIEEKLKLNDGDASAFCGCFMKFLLSALDELSDAHKSGRDGDDSKTHPCPDFEKQFCDICKKPFSEHDIEMANNICLFYGDDSQLNN